MASKINSFSVSIPARPLREEKPASALQNLGTETKGGSFVKTKWLLKREDSWRKTASELGVGTTNVRNACRDARLRAKDRRRETALREVASDKDQVLPEQPA